MADLQHKLPFARDGVQLVGLGQRGGDRLFHQHVLAGTQRRHSQRVVRVGRRGDDQRVAGIQQVGQRQLRRAGLPADRLGALHVRVVDADQRGAIRRGHLQRVKAAEMAGPGNADTQARTGHRLILCWR